MIREQCDADTRAGAQFAAGQVHRLTHRAQDGVRPHRRLGRVGLQQQDRKLIAAEARGHRLGSDAVAQSLCDRAQELIADAVAGGVVDVLELVRSTYSSAPLRPARCA